MDNSGGSLYLTRPSVVHDTSTHEELRARADDVFTRVSAGELTATTASGSRSAKPARRSYA
jgi:NADPH:quinone reductase